MDILHGHGHHGHGINYLQGVFGAPQLTQLSHFLQREMLIRVTEAQT